MNCLVISVTFFKSSAVGTKQIRIGTSNVLTLIFFKWAVNRLQPSPVHPYEPNTIA
jgi:hypothetical protein